MIIIDSELINEIKVLQVIDMMTQEKRKLIAVGKAPEFEMGPYDILRCNRYVCIPDNTKLRKTILDEALKIKLSIHPSTTKMLTKSAHFIPVWTTYDVTTLAKIYISEIVRLHGVPSSIVSDRDPNFISRLG
ncbi:uncharacterized protein [Cicer arietinum]|uniref:uncharacterized protein n=1 Tax=Cicer arietinum TaxID=3827 RepID=UPI003CC53B91